MFSARSSVRHFVCFYQTCKHEQNDFDAKLHKRSTRQEHETSETKHFEGQEVKGDGHPRSNIDLDEV